MRDKLELSIVLPNHNRRAALELTLQSLCRQTYPAKSFEALVVDQASTDGSRELVRSFQAPYRLGLVEQDGKYGVSAARNAGMEAASAALVLILDADMLAASETVQAHLEAHARHPGSLVCGRVLPYPPAYTTYVERCANPEAGLDRGSEEKRLPFHQAFGGHISLEQEIFELVGAFDTRLKGFEDIEFAYRARLRGFEIWNCPQAIGYHNHPRTIHERLFQVRNYQRMLPIIYQRYPEIQGKISDLLIYEPIHWREDPLSISLRKIKIRFLAPRFSRRILYLMIEKLEHIHISKRLTRGCFWQLYFVNCFLGYQDGSKCIRNLSI